MRKNLQKTIDLKLRETMEELADLGCMMTMVVLFPAEQGFNIGMNSNIPDPKLRLEVLSQADQREREAQGIPSQKIILTGNN